jgi:restriction endonuclease
MYPGDMSKAKKRFNHTVSGTQSTVSKGRMIEAIVASMHESDGVRVEGNVKLPPIGSQGPKREIDVLLNSEVCGYPVRWAFECKNEKKRIGAPYIDAFVGKLQDIGIPPQFGIFVTTSDYSKGAIEQAKKVGIRLLTIKDVLRDLGPTIQHAIQTTIFLLPIINGVQPH